MKTVGMFSAIIATWQATAGSFQTVFGTMPESVGMLLWGVSLLAFAGAARHRSAKDRSQGRETNVAPARPARSTTGMIETATVRFMGSHSPDSECAAVR